MQPRCLCPADTHPTGMCTPHHLAEKRETSLSHEESNCKRKTRKVTVAETGGRALYSFFSLTGLQRTPSYYAVIQFAALREWFCIPPRVVSRPTRARGSRQNNRAFISYLPFGGLSFLPFSAHHPTG